MPRSGEIACDPATTPDTWGAGATSVLGVELERHAMTRRPRLYLSRTRAYLDAGERSFEAKKIP